MSQKKQMHTKVAVTRRKGRGAAFLRKLRLRVAARWRATRDRRRSFLRALWRVLWRLGLPGILCAVLMGTLVLTVSESMVAITRGQVHTVEGFTESAGELIEERGGYDCILVLGAGVRADGSPSDMLYDRVMTACTAYKALKQNGTPIPLLMSGDHTGDYNEVGVMKELAMREGIDGTDIFLDHAGYSTYESLYRAREMFGAKRVLIITQGYHLHRALYIARELEMEADGIAADLRTYRGQSRYSLREKLARFKDFFVAARGEAIGETGPYVDLGGDGNLTSEIH